MIARFEQEEEFKNEGMDTKVGTGVRRVSGCTGAEGAGAESKGNAELVTVAAGDRVTETMPVAEGRVFGIKGSVEGRCADANDGVTLLVTLRS